MASREKKWWQDGTVYQIYPASFKDSNGDGMGDIPGIISKLDYIKDLGIDIVWLCPMYESPQFDVGYDISNYEKVYPPYGTLEDMDTLIAACHERGMRIILDLVVNHTSHLHPWFKESRSSKDNPKRDWYIWRPAKYDEHGNRKPPNNWRSLFGGSVWEWDEATQEYYLHLFLKEQPDLNWENETTRNAIYESAMEFWLRKGVDGFRLDTVNMYSKGIEFADAPVINDKIEYQLAADYYCNGPRMHEFLREMYAKVLSKYDAMTVGELPFTADPARVLQYVSAKEKQLNMVFQFDVISLGLGTDLKFHTKPFAFTLPDLKAAIKSTQDLIEGTDGWTTIFLENHDAARSITRFASDDPKYRVKSGKLLAMMLMALSGTLYLYQGQEIGMVNIPKDWPIEEYKDVEVGKYYKMIEDVSKGDENALREVFEAIQHYSRDHARTPMQWDNSPNSGFSTGKPWMRTHDLYKEINVQQQVDDKESVLSFWKRMLSLRKKHADLFIHGSFEIFDFENRSIFTFTKKNQDARALIVLNFTAEPQSFHAPNGMDGKLSLLATNDDGLGDLAPYEGRVFLVE